MKLESAIPVLRVGDYAAARAFWTDILNFSCVEEGGDPARFGIFKRDAAIVFVDGWHGADTAPAPCWRAYFHVESVADLAGHLHGKHPCSDPVETAYGMREITLTDPAGNLLCFGEDV